VNSNVVHQVMQSRLDHVHFRQDSELPDLATMVSRPTPNVILNMMKQFVHAAQL
jgi:hypothetical protein